MKTVLNFSIICLKRGEIMTFDFGSIWIGVSIIVAGGMLYAVLDKLVKALEKQK